MVKMIFSGKVLGILVCTPFLFVLSELSPQKSSPSGNFRLAGLLRLPLIGAILAQRTALHNTPLTFSPISRKFLHERPGTSGQLCSLRRNAARNSPLASGPAGQTFGSSGAESFHKPSGKLGRARRNAGLRTVFVVFCLLFSRFQRKFVYFFVQSANGQTMLSHV